MADAIPLDSDWLRDHPLPRPNDHADKNARGRVLAAGGCATVPGGIALTAEAALRAGAGKVQVATVAGSAALLGVAMPEVAVFALPEGPDGEIAACAAALAGRLDQVDAVVAGPAMACRHAAQRLLEAVFGDAGKATLVLDAAALFALPRCPAAAAPHDRALVLTPHPGEMAGLLKRDPAAIAGDRAGAVRRAADCYGAVCVLKGATTLIADPHGRLFAFAGGGVGLATGGSGDVLAGLVAGLAARGAPPLDAALWAVWLHGEAGRRCAERIGPIGFLARELLAHVPGLMRGF